MKGPSLTSALGAAIVVAITILGTPAAPIAAAADGSSSIPSSDAAIVHVLNRIGYGPRPGDVARVGRIGLARYIDEQLHPDRIPDPGAEARLAGLRTLGLSTRQLATDYLLPAIAARRRRAAQGANAPDSTGTPGTDSSIDGRGPAGRRQRMAGEGAPNPNLPIVELSEQKLIRAVYSERQLQEVLTDFWFNHFNVDARKGPDRIMLTAYERDVIRPHVLGRFRDLLEATAKSPAMLFYLDNWMSVAPDADAGRRRERGINENYGRELMELHTLGVDGGYTQKDVIEVARCFTGWTIAGPRMGGGFIFRTRLHDEGEKVVLGHRIPAGGGEEDGERVLDILAGSPATAHHIAFELAQRFVSDTPPPALVDRAAARYLQTGGDLREVVRTIITSPEFFAAADDGVKAKTPFEFVASALRATGADIENARPLVGVLRQMGMPLYMRQPPTGYADTADAWTTSGALLARMNFAVALAANRVPGVTHPWPEADTEDRAALMAAVLPGGVTAATQAAIDRAPGPVQALALAIGSPDFQAR